MKREEAIRELKIFSGTTKTRLSANFWKALEMAIKALSEESCGDCVSREQALKELKESAEHHANDSREEILLRRDRDIIRALPSVTLIHKDRTVQDFVDKCRECGKQRWIPCSEKLPEEEGDYLLWGKVCEDEDEYPFIGSYDSGCEQFGIWQEQFDATTLGCLGSEFFEYASVVAWMPLPEPYKAEMEK